jgi:hypothetical protein
MGITISNIAKIMRYIRIWVLLGLDMRLTSLLTIKKDIILEIESLIKEGKEGKWTGGTGLAGESAGNRLVIVD